MRHRRPGEALSPVHLCMLATVAERPQYAVEILESVAYVKSAGVAMTIPGMRYHLKLLEANGFITSNDVISWDERFKSQYQITSQRLRVLELSEGYYRGLATTARIAREQARARRQRQNLLQ